MKEKGKKKIRLSKIVGVFHIWIEKQENASWEFCFYDREGHLKYKHTFEENELKLFYDLISDIYLGKRK